MAQSSRLNARRSLPTPAEANSPTNRDSETINSDCDVYLIDINYSCVYRSAKNVAFSKTIWTRDDQFTRAQLTSKVSADFYPSSLPQDGETAYIGRVRTRISSSNIVTDQIGQYRRSANNLEIIHGNKPFYFDVFAVLNFEDAKCYAWKEVNLTSTLAASAGYSSYLMPRYALRLCYDMNKQMVLYAARSSHGPNVKLLGSFNSLTKEFTYYQPSKQKTQHDPKPRLSLATSNLVNSNNPLNAPNAGQGVQYMKKFELLCMKPSPAKLKEICRNRLREFFSYDNARIEGLEVKLERRLLNYVKCRTHLKLGKQLGQGECLISPNNKYRLVLDNNGRLLYQFNDHFKDHLFLYDNVEALWFNDLRLLVCFEDFTCKPFLTNFENMNIIFRDARVKLCDDGAFRFISPHHLTKIVIQLRDDMPMYINSKTPKFDCGFFFEMKEKDKAKLDANKPVAPTPTPELRAPLKDAGMLSRSVDQSDKDAAATGEDEGDSDSDSETSTYDSSDPSSSSGDSSDDSSGESDSEEEPTAADTDRGHVGPTPRGFLKQTDSLAASIETISLESSRQIARRSSTDMGFIRKKANAFKK